MKQSLEYRTKGTCATRILITLQDDRIESVQFVGGCSGNTQGIAALVQGMKAQDAIAKLRGIRCGFKSTSCPDQLAQALEQMLE